VLAFVNALFADVFPPRPDPQRPHLAPAQALAPHREPPGDMGDWPALVVVPVDVTPPQGQSLRAAQLRERDAAASAGIADALLVSRTPVAVLLRAVRGGHRAYVDALDGLGVATELAASGTFTREGATALGITLIRALAVPGHDAAWVALLRSPLVRLPERDVQHLCRWAMVNGRPVVEAVRWLLATEPLLLGACGAAMERLLGALGDGAELNLRMRQLFSAAQVESRQLDKLLAMVAGLEREGRGPAEIAEVFERLVADDRSKRVADPRPPDEETAGGGSVTPSLQALTVHASKGLEFATVITPQLFSASAGGAFVTPDAAWVDDGWRIGVAVPRGKPSVIRDANRALELEREEAERARLLYVAMTRARDRLVLVLPDGDPEALEAVDTPVTRAIRRLLVSAAPASEVAEPSVASLDGQRVEVRWSTPLEAPQSPANVEAVAGGGSDMTPAPPVAFDGPAVWPVTSLARLAYCPAYYAQHALAPAGGRPPLDAPEPHRGSMRGQERGIEVHDLLASLTDEASLSAVETEGRVPERLVTEWSSLSGKLRALMSRSDLAPLFTRSGLWREFALEGRVEGVTLSGALDRLAVGAAEGAEGEAVRAVIGEFKTGGRGFAGPGGHEPAYGLAYRFQLAAYVVMLHGWLGGRLVEPVTTHLVFVDLNQVVTEAWTTAQAAAEVGRVVREIHHPWSLPLHHAACPECPLNASCAAR